MLQHDVPLTMNYMDLRISDGLSEASVRLEARFTTGSSKDRQQTGYLIFVIWDRWVALSILQCNEGAARGEYPEKNFQNDRWDLTKWR
jgi:hypothetical protein